MLAASLGAAEADEVGQLAPVDRVEPAMFTRDRHNPILNHRAQERKQKTPRFAVFSAIPSDAY